MYRYSGFFITLALATLVAVNAAATDPEVWPFSYDYTTEAALAAKLDVANPDPAQLREIFAKRRARVLEAMPEGAMIIYTVERTQERRLEFQVPHSDNRDFIYLTGLDGIEDVRPFRVLENDLSVAMTDFRDWRITQVRRWPLAAALSRA